MKSILIIDDEVEILSILSFRLENWGYKAIKSDNGHDALVKIYNDKPDLVLLDIMMPVMDGFEVLEKIKEKEETKRIPIIVVSVVVSKKEVEKSISLGANYYINKPYDAHDLKNKISMLIGEGEK
ncbi:MAG: two-component system chemotaxis family response regulator CheY [Candidatus Saganbacteria bacterium]|uniref:Two-component system chemotaxis family response regulator CheY n=1 Tax=Candidatus Saganbacteria bacterium TaxID=2575572 RepID=A0A833L0P2_UNCSA|nr:MAG: two-component system chemotaxis family response regulator CheY [Candidatus Saganbacteria bacterium]